MSLAQPPLQPASTTFAPPGQHASPLTGAQQAQPPCEEQLGIVRSDLSNVTMKLLEVGRILELPGDRKIFDLPNHAMTVMQELKSLRAAVVTKK